jgi:hypothetical protein
MADKANLRLLELLSFRSIQVRFAANKGIKYRSIKLKFHKIWDLTQYDSVQALHHRHTIVTSLSSALKSLFAMIRASYKDRMQDGDTRRETIPPFILGIDKFVAHVDNL